jgi:hypothetical protein
VSVGQRSGLKLEDVKTPLRHEDIATTTNVYGDLGMDVKRRIQQLGGVRQGAGKSSKKEASRIEKAWACTPYQSG